MSNWEARELAERRWEWLDSMRWSVCEVCSAIVWDSDEHDDWHARQPATGGAA
jgi:hypothetical protein